MMGNKPITWRQKHKIRNDWCDRLCSIFNYYYKNRKTLQIHTPLYTAQVISTFGLLDFNSIDFSESKINFVENPSRTNNENLIYKCFDELIQKKDFIGNHLTEFRNYFNQEEMPF